MAAEPDQVCTCGQAAKRSLKAGQRKRLDALMAMLEDYFTAQRPTADARRKAMDFIRAFQHKVFCVPDLRTIEEYFRRLAVVKAWANAGDDSFVKRDIADFYDDTPKAAGTFARLAKRRAEMEAAKAMKVSK